MKKTGRMLTLIDEGTTVKTELSIKNNLGLNYLMGETKEVRIRSPLPDKKQLIKNLKYFAELDSEMPTVQDQAAFYIYCREKAIIEQIQEIRKSMKRMSKQLECIRIAEEALEEFENNTL